MRFQHAIRLAVVAFISIPATHLMATVISPIDLPPGSQYQLIFTTADGTKATDPNIGTYNAFVNTQAAESTSPVVAGATWYAVASTPTTDAYLNAVSDGTYPVYNTAGQKVQSAGTSIYSVFDLVNPPAFDQNGNAVGAFPYHVWTGSQADGARFNAEDTLGHPPFEVVEGEAHQTTYTIALFANENFLYANASDGGSILSLPLYALSGPITSPVPEPASILLLGSALLLFGGIHFLRQRRRASGYKAAG